MSPKTPPKISVVMSVYNGEKYLQEAVDSILKQTFIDFEFIIINDGSTDKTREILELYSDPRIRLFHQDNIGLTISLNRGLKLAKGEYIARMDADDISLPLRFWNQVAFLDKNKNVGIVGGNCIIINSKGEETGFYRVPLKPLQIYWASNIANPFVHPSVMIRNSLLKQNAIQYDERFSTTQDYELWVRFLKISTGANIKEFLVKYRQTSNNTSSKYRATQLFNHDKISFGVIQERFSGLEITQEQISLMRGLFVGGDDNVKFVQDNKILLVRLYLRMFELFLKGKKHLNVSFKHQEAIKILRIIELPPFQPGTFKIIRILIKLSPILIFVIKYFSLLMQYAHYLLKKLFDYRSSN